MEKKAKDPKPGDVFYLQNGPFKYKCHVVTILLNYGYKILVYKHYPKHRGRWVFETKDITYLNNP